jgi:ATP-dependent DNA helicase DinG
MKVLRHSKSMVRIEVRGSTRRFHDVLRNSYDLRWDKLSMCYAGDMKLSERRIRNLVRFCEKFNLPVSVDGVQFKSSEEETEDEDSFTIEPVKTSRISALGKVGTETLMPTKEGVNAPGYKEILLTQDSEIDFDNYQRWVDETLFEDARPEQQQVIPAVAKVLRQGYKNIIIESPTGSGKSAFSMVLPKMFGSDKKSSYVLTHLKGLQAQYLAEMPFMESIMGRGNYSCKLDVEAGCRDIDVAESAVQRARAGIAPAKSCTADTAPCVTIKDFQCPYKNPKEGDKMRWDVDPTDLCDYYGSLTKAQNSDYFVANMAYAAAIGMTPMLPQREFLIVDEAHNLPDVMVGAFTLDLSERLLERLLGVKSLTEILELSGSEQVNAHEERKVIMGPWRPRTASKGFPRIPSVTMDMKETIIHKAAAVWVAYLNDLDKEIQTNLKNNFYKDTKDLKLAMRTTKRLETIVAGLTHDTMNWIWQVSDERTFVNFKCIEIKEFAESLLLHAGRRRIFMSATIGNPKMFCEELGLDLAETAFIKVGYSSFPVENRPVYTRETGGLLTRQGQTDTDWRNTAKTIIEIMEQHPNQQGIILPYTDRIDKQLTELIAEINPAQARRLIRHDKTAHGRDAAIQEWKSSQGGAIMSTYLNQGFDGKEAAYCIVVKLPYLSLGDVRTAKKMKATPAWYSQQTGISLAQMCGRAVRSRTDKANTYIIDPSFWFQYSKGVAGRPLKDFLPAHLCESIEKYEGLTANGIQQKL